MALVFDPAWSFTEAAILAGELRDADRRECEAWGMAPVEVLVEGLRGSSLGFAWLLRDDAGRAIGACGAADGMEGEGCPWLMGAPDLSKRYRRDFLTTLPALLRKVQSTLPSMRGLMDARNTLHRRWCERLGFTFEAPVKAGPYGLPFLPFRMET